MNLVRRLLNAVVDTPVSDAAAWGDTAETQSDGFAPGAVSSHAPVFAAGASRGTTQTTTGSAPVGQSMGSVPPPSWIATLNDATLKADMTAAVSTGTVSEAGMAQLFGDLDAELAAGKTTLSASQFNDLKTIAADLNVGEVASSYVTYITNALINGNASNATWTGGDASSTSLGNLGVGSTAAQIGELDGKWFMGTDLPSTTVQLSGEQPFGIYYSTMANPVFAATGPSINDINQGVLGDCYLLASLAEVACQDPSLIQSMITDNGDNTFGVRFFVDGNAEYVTVNNNLADNGTVFNDASDMWASLVEKAYAQMQAGGVITGNTTINDGNSYSTIGNGGFPEYALEAITDASAITDFYASGTSWMQCVYDDTLTVQQVTSGLTTASVLATLASELAAGCDAVLASNTYATDAYGRTTLVADHALSIYGYDSATGLLEIRNPWGSAVGQSWDTTFEISLSTLLADGDTITIDNISTLSPPSVVAGALVSAAAGLQASATVTAFSISDTAANVGAAFASLASDTKLTSISFTDPGVPALSLTAVQYTADTGVLAKVASAYTLTVTAATVSGAAALQKSTNVTAFSVSDTAANVTAARTALNADGKLAALTISGTASADTLNLTGSKAAATINLGGDTAKVSAGLTSPSLKFIGTPDTVTLGTGAATINYSLAPGSGIEVISNFQPGLDDLNIMLNGAANSALHAANTTYNGQHSIALYSSADPTHGVVLANVSSSLTASKLMASHVTFGGGVAVIS
jgi:hypothetical protein